MASSDHLARIERCLVAILLTVAVLGRLASAVMPSVVPKDTTANVGDTIQLECQPPLQSDELKWYIYRIGQPDQKIFTAKNGDVKYLTGANQNKFGNNGTNLILKSLEESDAATYSCSVSPIEEAYANLVVIKSLDAYAAPNTQLSVGSSVTFTCTLSYSPPNSNFTQSRKPLDSKQDPKLMMYVGQRQLDGVMVDQEDRQKMATVNTTVTQDFIGNNFFCVMMSEAGGVMVQKYANVSLNLANSVAMNFNVVPVKNEYLLDDSVNCTVTGNPLPTVKWVPIGGQTNPSYQSGPGWATLTFNTPGQNITWNCSAQATMNSPPVLKMITFKVSDQTKANVGSTASLRVHLTSGLAVACMVVFTFSLNLLKTFAAN